MTKIPDDSASAQVRALAHRLNVDLSIVTPSGADGSISAQDVERVHRVLTEVGPLERLAGARKSLAQAMTQARGEAAAATVCEDAVLDAGHGPAADLSLRLIRAIVAGVAAEPALNAWFDPGEMGRRVLSKVHLGLVVDSAEGQFVPVMQDVGNRTPESLRAGLEKLKHDMGRRAVPAEELRGYTITLANFGAHGGRYASALIQPPTVAVVCAGKVRDALVAMQGQPRVAPVLPLNVTFDQRAVTMGEAARFLAAMVGDLERPG